MPVEATFHSGQRHTENLLPHISWPRSTGTYMVALDHLSSAVQASGRSLIGRPSQFKYQLARGYHETAKIASCAVLSLFCSALVSGELW